MRVRAWARAKDGSQHLVRGGVLDGESYDWTSIEQAFTELIEREWTPVSSEILDEG